MARARGLHKPRKASYGKPSPRKHVSGAVSNTAEGFLVEPIVQLLRRIEKIAGDARARAP